MGHDTLTESQRGRCEISWWVGRNLALEDFLFYGNHVFFYCGHRLYRSQLLSLNTPNKIFYTCSHRVNTFSISSQMIVMAGYTYCPKLEKWLISLLISRKALVETLEIVLNALLVGQLPHWAVIIRVGGDSVVNPSAQSVWQLCQGSSVCGCELKNISENFRTIGSSRPACMPKHTPLQDDMEPQLALC